MFRRGKMSAAFELAAFNLDVHELSKTVASSSGVHLIYRVAYVTLLGYDTSHTPRPAPENVTGGTLVPTFPGANGGMARGGQVSAN